MSCIKAGNTRRILVVLNNKQISLSLHDILFNVIIVWPSFISNHLLDSTKQSQMGLEQQ